ncbi:fas apoptotic inhibitory molecule 1-like [Girardinichthys multiradiatus]|uniref:fas apoptotic inhibitory molecule 1-like n=1 Tax=Girardinichthys multiradiatus TaxID=208333 RepID=UPI001FADC3D2|nr:fas apoptotic inhibitory molecule 1-like [Girardinichthys multiradiatus]XP_047211245.1 fas apoptotic inhibitory molecule 1-like [Girardinichthys multiradiatus]
MQLLLRRQDPVPSAFQLLRTSSAESRMVCGDVVAVWEVALSDGVYRIEFAHGTTTGKRVVYVNGTEVLRKDWMFKLVGKETFMLGRADTKATINIEAISGFTYEYSLNVDGKSLQKFIDNRAKTTKTWVVQVDGTDYRVVLEKDTMDVWCNGQKMDTTGEFVDDGTETHFLVGEHDCCIKAMSCGKKKNGIVHCLLLDGEKVPAPTQ